MLEALIALAVSESQPVFSAASEMRSLPSACACQTASSSPTASCLSVVAASTDSPRVSTIAAITSRFTSTGAQFTDPFTTLPDGTVSAMERCASLPPGTTRRCSCAQTRSTIKSARSLLSPRLLLFLQTVGELHEHRVLQMITDLRGVAAVAVRGAGAAAEDGQGGVWPLASSGAKVQSCPAGLQVTSLRLPPTSGSPSRAVSAIAE